ncbi:MAG: class I SAM-dependent methyltransferase, partial [Chloroflexia bacterium]
MPPKASAKLSPWYRPSAFRYTGILSLANLEENSSHGKMLSMAPPGSRVLETGCANGRFSRVLVEHDCRVVGVELDEGAASDAAQFCEQVIVGNLEATEIQQQIPDGFDLILFGDVLEHLAEPWNVLQALRPKLKPGGCIVISIPNVAHWDVRIGLLAG